jgi:trigger factor
MNTQIKLENVSSIQKKFIVTIPAEQVTQTVEKKFFEVQKTAKIKGFRPGKVPINLVKQYYAEDVKSRALQTLIDQTYREALKQHPIRIVGEPQIEAAQADEHGNHLHIHEGESLSYTALVEVVPEVEPKDYSGLSLEKPSPEVTDEDIAAVRKNLLDRKANMEPVDRAAKAGDFVEFKYEGKIKTDAGYEAQPNLNGTRQAEIGSGQLIPEFEKNIIGMKTGETKTFKMSYAEDYTDALLAGKSAEYEVSLREVKEKQLPAFSDEFAKEQGYESIKDFEAKTKESMVKTKADESDNQLRNQLIEKLIEKNSFEVPQALIMHQIRALADDYAQELKRYGFNDQMINSAVVRQLEDFKKRAESQVKAGILLDSIGKKEKIEAKPADIEAEMKKMAGLYNVDVQTLRDQMEENPRGKSNFEFRVREELTIQYILGKAKIKEVKATAKKG